MKKHLTSIQSTKPGEEGSIFSYDDRQTKFSYKTSILKLFYDMGEVLKLRSYLLYRDLENIFQNSEIFFQKVLNVYTVKQLWQFIFQNKNKNQKVHEKQQILFLTKTVFHMDKLRKQAANQGKTKQFQILKIAIETFEQKISQHQKKIRRKKYEDKMQKKQKEKQQKLKEFYTFQKNVRQNLQENHNRLKSNYLEKAHLDTINNQKELQNTSKFTYKVKPSKFLSQAKDISLKAKLAPYAAELKRSYDYKSLSNSLSKTLDLDMSRKLSLISHMKKVEKQKINKIHQKRYSVLEDRLNQEKNRTQRQLSNERSFLQNNERIQFEKLYQANIRQQYSKVQSLQKSFNVYNMHSDSKQIKKILRNHRQTIQFSNQMSEVSSLYTSPQYRPIYGTLANQMLEQTYADNQKRREGQYDKKVLRKFNKSKKQNEQGDSDAQADDICGSNQQNSKLTKEKSLVALYDNQLNQVKS